MCLASLFSCGPSLVRSAEHLVSPYPGPVASLVGQEISVRPASGVGRDSSTGTRERVECPQPECDAFLGHEEEPEVECVEAGCE